MTRPVLVDANVLFRSRLRELLLALAAERLLVPLWTTRIIEEAAAGLVRDGRLAPDQRDGWIEKLSDPAFLVDRQHPLECTFGLPDKDDEHVLAAAVHAGSDRILTFNIRDFPKRTLGQYGIVAEMPDGFLLGLQAQSPDAFLKTVESARESILPPVSAEEHRAMLRRAGLVRTMKRLRTAREGLRNTGVPQT